MVLRFLAVDGVDPGTEVLVVAGAEADDDLVAPTPDSVVGRPAAEASCDRIDGDLLDDARRSRLAPAKAKVEVIVKKIGICAIKRTDWDIWSVIKRSPFLFARCFGTDVGEDRERVVTLSNVGAQSAITSY